MANIFNSNPMILDTDFSSYRSSASTSFGVRPSGITLSVGSSTASSAGVVTITRPADGVVIYPPLPVEASQTVNTVLYQDNLEDKALLNWNNFAVTGLTATGTKLYVWYNI